MSKTGDNRELRNRARVAREHGVPPSEAGATTGSSRQPHHRARDDQRPDAGERLREQLERPHDNPRETRPSRGKPY